MEVVQAEAGVIAADAGWLKRVRAKCDETGALLIFDEIQTGFGRTGTLWAFEKYDIVPDILLLGKALGGGLPLGAFISSHEKMQALTNNPVLGHISTFAGHPVCCAAGLAGFELLMADFFCHKDTTAQSGTKDTFLMDNGHKDTKTQSATKGNHLVHDLYQKEKLFHSLLKHGQIKEVRSSGLLMAVELESAEVCQSVCHACVKAGVVTDWFLFAPHCLRIAPPLIISDEEIRWSCKVILDSIDKVVKG
jgi:acetylornithine/succinyldiaminopimelate/putrescine aminotransferase